MEEEESRRVSNSLQKTRGYDVLRGVVNVSTCTKCRDELLQRATRLSFDEWYVDDFVLRYKRGKEMEGEC
jgi:hypothetical protein